MSPKKVLPPKKAGEFIAAQAKHVKVKEEGIKTLGDVILGEIRDGKLSTDNFSQVEVHPKPDDPKALDWIFVADTLNFCFWHNEDETGWSVDGKTGYFALCAALNRAIKEGVDILNPKFYSSITEKQVSEILRSDNSVPIPLLQKRVECLHEVGTVLLEKYEGSFKNVVEKAGNSALKLLDLIVTSFKCFRDEAEFKGQTVGIYKRAQILIGDVWACFNGKGVGFFEDIDEITMFADYRVPQTLLFFKVLEYGEELKKVLEKYTVLEYGDEMEVEIRGCCIYAVELLKDYVNKRVDSGGAVNSILIDHFLWDYRRKNSKEILEKVLPFHKTFSIYY